MYRAWPSGLSNNGLDGLVCRGPICEDAGELSKLLQMSKSYKYIDLITALFAVILLVSNIVSSKILVLGPFTFDGGTVLFPLSYILGDVLTEVYGYKRARRVIWMGFFLLLLAMLTIVLVGALPAAAEWQGQAAYETILGLTPRIIMASLMAYFAGEFINSYILAKLKVETQGRMLWARLLGSSVVGHFVDSAIFVTVAFAGVLEPGLLWAVMISNNLFKLLVEIVVLPLTYRVVARLKKAEGEDYYDYKTNFNPFRLK